MKKTLLALLALVLCMTMLLVACTTDSGVNNEDANNNDNQTNDNQNNNDQNNNDPTKETLNKETLIDSFNKLDLYSIYKTINDGLEETINLESIQEFDFSTVEQQVSGEVTQDGEVLAAISAAIKNGIVHVEYSQGEDGDETFMYITNGFEVIEFYRDFDGKWVADVYEEEPDYGWDDEVTDYTTYSEEEEDVDLLTSLFGIDFEILKRITIPALTEANITEKDGKLVINNAYFVDVVLANFDLLLEVVGSEGAPTKDEFKAELEEAIEMLGLEVAFEANDQTITAIYVSITPPETEEMGVESMGLSIKLSDNGKVLKSASVHVSVPTDELDYSNGFAVTLENTLNGDTITAAKLTAELDVIEYDYSDDSEDVYDDNGYYYEYFAVCSKINAEIFIEVPTADADAKLSVTASMNTEKVYKVSEYYSYETYESTYEVVEVETEGYGTEFAGKLLATFDADDLKCDIDFELDIEGVKYAASLEWLLDSAPDFPEVPEEITDYINSIQ